MPDTIINHLFLFPTIMEQPSLQNLKYGIIYLYSDRRYSPGIYDPEAIVAKFVHPMKVEWVDDPGRGDLLLIARRFNVGNIGQYATVSLSLSRLNRSGGWFEAIRHFADSLMGITDAGDGDIVINENDFGYDYNKHSSVYGGLESAAPQDNTRVKSRWKRYAERLRGLIAEDDGLDDNVSESLSYSKESAGPDHLDYLQEEEDNEVARLELERNRALERIKREIVNYIARYQEDPKELMAELLRGKVVVGQPGRVLINGDMKVVLPEYDELEIPMPAMCRTLYILFMKLRKQGDGGIILKNMDEHRDEIINIYSMVKPGASEERVAQTVDNLCNPLSDSLNQMISRINRCIKNVITDKELARSYTITGKKGMPYSIGLAPECLELPRAVTGA